MRGTSFPLGLRRPGCCGCRGDQAVAIRAQESVMWKRLSMRSVCSVAGAGLRSARQLVSVEEELLGQRRQVAAPGLRHDDEILDPDAPEARVVQPWLHGDHVADLEDDIRLADPWVLVNLEPEPMSRPVDEACVALDVAIGLGK